MPYGLAAVDQELEGLVERIKQLESDLFFERIRLAGLKAAKDALLRGIVLRDEGDE